LTDVPFPIEIDIWQGDLADLEVDAIVVPANESLFMTSGVAAAVKRVAGDAVERDAVTQGPVPPGRVVVTGGGELAAPWVIHAVGVGHDLRADPAQLEAAIEGAFDAAEAMGLKRLALAPLGVERGVFPPADAALLMLGAIAARSGRPGAPTSIVIAVTSPADGAAYASALETIRTAAS
jgi:O-acetyl-ADP-ribose deacetylase (regulator of RNase III)